LPNQISLRKNFEKNDFKVGAPALKLALWHLVSAIFFRSAVIPFSSILVFLLRIFGAKIGKEVRIKPGIYIYYPWKLVVGDYSWLAECRIENLDWVKIGNHVCVSQQAMLLTGNHDYKKPNFDLITKPIALENGSWIGARAVVCPGVTVNSHAILTVGAIATKDLAAYGIYQGNPAVKVKDRVID
jgi:putative colanic acid biosynthesis acetyltransferase WcaF